MPSVIDALTFIKSGQKYHGNIIGYEADYFWLLVPELNSVFVGNPNRIFTHAGEKYFEIFDHHQTLDQIFSKTNEPESYIFEYSNDPEKIKSLIKAYRLLTPKQSPTNVTNHTQQK